jgi:adenine phosphoribosyltransferase
VSNYLSGMAGVKSATDRLRAAIRDVPDFPSPGIVFKDITPILQDQQMFRLAIGMFADRYQRKRIDQIVAIDARGFLFGAPLAYVLGTGVSIVRKKGKLPWRSIEATYQLEYGQATVEMHHDSLQPGQKVIVIDDVLATGGTMRAAIDLCQRLGAEVVEAAVLVELSFLKGRASLAPTDTFSVLSY